jgi:hypothetical protein
MGWTPESLADADENRALMEGGEGSFAHINFFLNNVSNEDSDDDEDEVTSNLSNAAMNVADALRFLLHTLNSTDPSVPHPNFHPIINLHRYRVASNRKSD